MTQLPHRRSLPLSPAHPGGRSASVCHYRCGNACAQPAPNTSGNSYFGDVVRAALSRRALIGGAAAAAGLAVAREVVAPTEAYATSGHGTSGLLNFTAIEPVASTVDSVTVPKGYEWSAIIRWGDPVLAGAPGFDFEHQTAAAQAKQFGYNNDFVALLPLGRDRGLLVANHEYTNESLMFRGWTSDADATVEQLRTAMNAHGMSVVEVSRAGTRKPWKYLRRSSYNRRILIDTPFRFTGPATGSTLLRTSADPTGRTAHGTLNNCAGGVTPWGTVLSGEENFNQYFAVPSTPEDAQVATGYTRYGITTAAGREWQRADTRFDTSVEPHEPHRFGWVVEIDPTDPHRSPRKHTALGRLKHEGANVRIADDGRAVVYMGDDERFEYLYKFVSHRKFRKGPSKAARAHNLTLLESGDLYVAKFTGDTASEEHDGDGTWLPLVLDGVSQVEGMDVDEVLVFTRAAADKVGATQMDRPEDVEPNPVTGRVYMACTNNTRRTAAQVDAANPRPSNKDGHVVELTEDGDDAAACTFSWRILLLCGSPDDESSWYSGFDKSLVSPISCPDNLAFDANGTLWISTDGQPDAIGLNDALHAVPLKGSQRGHVQQFLAVPTGAETCGPVISFDQRAVLVAVQHPGDVDGATPETPASTFPYDGLGQPRPSVIQVRRRDGGRVVR